MNNEPRFQLGEIVATPGALAAMEAAGEMPQSLLSRHQCGEFGQLSVDDVRIQNDALQFEGDPDRQERMMSVYSLKNQTIVWIITEADRSSTCILLPQDY